MFRIEGWHIEFPESNGGKGDALSFRCCPVGPGTWNASNESVSTQFGDESGGSVCASSGLCFVVGRFVEFGLKFPVAEASDQELARDDGRKDQYRGGVNRIESGDATTFHSVRSAKAVEVVHGLARERQSGKRIEYPVIGATPHLTHSVEVSDRFAHGAPPSRPGLLASSPSPDLEVARIIDGRLNSQNVEVVVDLG